MDLGQTKHQTNTIQDLKGLGITCSRRQMCSERGTEGLKRGHDSRVEVGGADKVA